MMYQQVKVDRMLVWKVWDLVWTKTKLWIDQWIDPVIHGYLIGLVTNQ